jgi:hypothetical protein
MDDMMPSMERPDHPAGMCISLTEIEMEKLELDDNVEVGDLLHLRIMIEATSVHKTSDGVRIEAAIVGGEVEDESTEGDDEDEEEEGE